MVFVGHKFGSKEAHRGTAFYVSHQRDDEAGPRNYLVTAKHVIEKSEKQTADGHILIRYCRSAGGAEWFNTFPYEWYRHPDTDVAIYWPDREPDGVTAIYLNSRMGITWKEVHDGAVGVGNQAVAVGMFTRHTGGTKLEPIARFGTITSLPRSDVKTEDGQSVKGYLLETHSLGGISGSPVFAVVDTSRQVATTRNRPDARIGPVEDEVADPTRWPASACYLLGLVHGHWGIDDTRIDITQSYSGAPLNMGVSVVIPFDAITEVLDDPKLRQRQMDHPSPEA